MTTMTTKAADDTDLTVPAVPAVPEETPLAPVVEGQSTLEFFTIDGLSRALVASSYSVAQEMAALVGIVQDTDIDPMVRMAAVRMVRDHLEKALIMSGNIRSMEATSFKQLGEGHHAVARLSAKQLVGLGSQSVQLLDAGVETGQVIEAEEETQNAAEGRTGADGSGEPAEAAESVTAQEAAEAVGRAIDEANDPRRAGGGLCRSAKADSAESADSTED
jgi:hypothetical protein